MKTFEEAWQSVIGDAERLPEMTQQNLVANGRESFELDHFKEFMLRLTVEAMQDAMQKYPRGMEAGLASLITSFQVAFELGKAIGIEMEKEQ